MTETVIITNKIGTHNRYTSKYGAIYARIDKALNNGEEIIIDKFESFPRALALAVAIRANYSDCAYISFTKYGRNGEIRPRITISPRSA